VNNHYTPRRFSGVTRIYGQVAYQGFQASHICVIGLGGVGSWVVEALARSAIGEFSLIDLDHVAESNINRQLQATESNLGKAKTRALAERVLDINPNCRVHCIETFISNENQAEILNQNYDWVIDCIDNFRTKAALIAYCRRNKIKLLTIGGAGGMVDPAKIKQVDLSRSRQDPLFSKVRKQLRQEYAFPTNLSRRFNIPCIYSEEQLLYPDDQGNVSHQKPSQANATSGLNCANGFGSSVCVTASFGFYAASYILNKLALMAKKSDSI
jgi:tRNA A37 threonylcarbamoyladenosine dehydratase